MKTAELKPNTLPHPECVNGLVLKSSGGLRTEVGLEELPRHLADPRSLIWCDIASTEGGQQGPYGRLLREVFGFDELTIEDCFTKNHLPGRRIGSRPTTTAAAWVAKTGSPWREMPEEYGKWETG